MENLKEMGYFHKIKIDRSYKKNLYTFYVYTIKGSFDCIVRQSCTVKQISATIDKDLKSIILSEEIKIESLNGYHEKYLNKLTVPKDNLYKIKETLNEN